MPYKMNAHDLIIQLKAIRKEQELTLQEIYDRLEKANEHISMCTIQKVFADGSEHHKFRYGDTIQPIANVLLGVPDEDSGKSEIDALVASLRIKDDLIERQSSEIDALKAEYARKSEFLVNQIALKDERIDRLMARVDVLLTQIQRLLDWRDISSDKRM